MIFFKLKLFPQQCIILIKSCKDIYNDKIFKIYNQKISKLSFAIT